MSNVTNLYSKIKNENPYASFFTGPFQFWWPGDDTTAKGREIENILSSLGLSQLISEPTNFEPNKKPSCIDLVITDQSNFVLDSGTRASRDSFYRHQITYCTVNFNIPPPPFERRIWHYHRTDTALLRRSMCSFPWVQHLNTNQDPNWQVKTFTKIVMNIMTNFIPNEIKRIVPRDPPCITKLLKTMLNRKNRLIKNYKRQIRGQN